MNLPPTELLSRIRNLEPMPHVALRVLELSQRKDVVPRELIAVIQTEPALTAKILRLTNSAYYGFKRQIASLDEAGNLLGTGTLVNLVLTGCGARYFHECPTRDDGRRAARWQRAISCALATNLLTKVTQTGDPGRAYTAGLLQDLGELVLDGLPAEYANAFADELAHGVPRLDAEQRVFGLTHAEIGARLATRWNFPEVLIDTIRHHHAPERATVDPHLAALVNLAAEVVHELEDEAHPGADAGCGYSTIALSSLGLDELALSAMHEPLQRELERAREFVDAT
ncbi:MAG: HDOD domain-containing protein [Planctomycetes bacterium]|nr:HDOD domain-containing protein [Planctomycetota bacterium]